MKSLIRAITGENTGLKCLALSLAILLSQQIGFASEGAAAINLPQSKDSALLINQVNKLSQALHYPASVARFYKANGAKRIWVYPDTVKSPIWQAMILLDCVLQFGLNRQDFHPDKLSYQQLQPLNQSTLYADETERCKFDIYLTDALLTMINHLHYGKFNPFITSFQIEKGNLKDFSAERLLAGAINTKAFMETVVSAQPKSKAYKDLQGYLHLVKGQYIDDCYEFPEGDARKMAVNMERMRWLGNTEPYFIQINIPSFELKLVNADSVHTFKVIVGKPASPSPELQSKVTYLTTAPDWNVPQKIFYNELLPRAIKDSLFLNTNHYSIFDDKGVLVQPTRDRLIEISRKRSGYSLKQSSGCDNSLGKIVFRFPNAFDIYLHDTPDQKLFKMGSRAFSHGCIRVENAELLAEMLLSNDRSAGSVSAMKNSLAAMKRKHFPLLHPVPIKITYFTCEIVDGMFSSYPDIYRRDKALEEIMFPKQELLVKGK